MAVTGRELALLAVMLSLAVLAALGLWVSRRIYGHGETAVSGSPDVMPAPLRMDVNTATVPELTMLRGIGPKTAAAIVAYREDQGPFATLEDLQNVHGIGPATVEAIRPHAMCAPPDREDD
jgi:competence protein ComEA